MGTSVENLYDDQFFQFFLQVISCNKIVIYFIQQITDTDQNYVKTYKVMEVHVTNLYRHYSFMEENTGKTILKITKRHLPRSLCPSSNTATRIIHNVDTKGIKLIIEMSMLDQEMTMCVK